MLCFDTLVNLFGSLEENSKQFFKLNKNKE